MFVTPPTQAPAKETADNKRKRASYPRRTQESVAQPCLKKGKTQQMKRTPQHNMAQSRLTSAGGTLSLSTGVDGSTTATSGSSRSSGDDSSSSAMDIALQAPTSLGSEPGTSSKYGTEPLTADFFKNLIGENTRMVTGRIDTLLEDLLGLARRVEDNTGAINANKADINQQASIINLQREVIEKLKDRVGKLESAGATHTYTDKRSGNPRSDAYLKARRSIRIWPINHLTEESLWKGTGDFIHKALSVPEEDLSPDDIESIASVKNPRVGVGHVHDEAVVTFYCRDILLAAAQNMSSFVDDHRRPTAGIRLEIPPKLDGTFRLLSRFGARLRARHGEGTKRHIKFDDIEGSLCVNIKLPGDERWSNVSPAMAKADHDCHVGEESKLIMKRISATSTVSCHGDGEW